jgi:hypothetical protein
VFGLAVLLFRFVFCIHYLPSIQYVLEDALKSVISCSPRLFEFLKTLETAIGVSVIGL